jgi:hypothetical protein
LLCLSVGRLAATWQQDWLPSIKRFEGGHDRGALAAEAGLKDVLQEHPVCGKS